MFYRYLLIMAALICPLKAAQHVPFIVADHVTGWPNLVHLPEGTLLMFGFDQPSHGQVEGDVSCWISEDQGDTWRYHSTLTRHEPDTNRMNHAVGLTSDGRLLALVSGWSNSQQPGKEKRKAFRDSILDFWVCSSNDNGKNWSVSKDSFVTDPQGNPLIPFGDIFLAEDGTLRACVYANNHAYMIISQDDGHSWHILSEIETGKKNETALFYAGNSQWLAAARFKGLSLLRSADDGTTWKYEGTITEPDQHPGHFLKLSDGRILLSYGNRKEGQMGVCAKLTSDEGRTWTAPLPLASMPLWDGGYPESVQLADGRILTVFYSRKPDNTDDYAVYGLKWDLPPATKK